MATPLQTIAGTIFRRERLMGILFLLMGLAILLLFAPSAQPNQLSTFNLDIPSGLPVRPISIPSPSIPTLPGIYLMGLTVAFLGGWQLARGFKPAYVVLGMIIVVFIAALLTWAARGSVNTVLGIIIVMFIAAFLTWAARGSVNAVLGIIVVIFIAAFLTWAARGKAFNLTGMLASTLLRATPIALGALCGIWCERSAVINIGIEGMMLSGAFTAVIVSSVTDNLFLGLLTALLTGALMAAFLALLAIRFRVDQIVAGTVINIFATGLTSFFSGRFLEINQELNASATFQPMAIPGLAQIPVLGPIFFQNNLVVYLMLVLVVVTHIVLFYTRWGLRSRAVGEHPLAADTLGINVIRTRYTNVIIGGMIAGLGGAYFTLSSVGRFDEVMTAGKGFIGLAAMIFGKWTSFGAFGSSLIFGFADSLQVKLSILNVPIPSSFLLMAPYLVTMIVLAGVVGRAIPPAADGQPYEKQ